MSPHPDLIPALSNARSGAAASLAPVLANTKSLEALTHNEKWWQSIFANCPVSIAIGDMNGRYVATNSSFRRMLGYTGEDMPADCNLFTESVPEKGVYFKNEKQHRRKDGSLIWLQIGVYRVPADQSLPQFLVALVEDITERKRAEEVSHENEIRFRAVLDNSPNLVFLKDPKGRYLYVNRGFEKALGIRQDEAFGKKDEELFPLEQATAYLEGEIRREHGFSEIVGKSPSLQRVLKQVEIVAATDSSVLILGETGTGKELIARAIHNLSPRRERTLVRADCASIPAGLLESELFGHEKGAFTGAVARIIGRFELANEGTLFLDEVGDIPLELQSKLLRVLQEQELERLGSTRTIRLDFRLVAATNRDLSELVESGRFRRDLYYRLNVFPIEIPPLRDRKEDIPLLVWHFAKKYAQRLNKRIEKIGAEDMAELSQYHWPGNVRELQNLMERSVILSSVPVLHFPLSHLSHTARNTAPRVRTLAEAEREHILQALQDSDWVIGGRDGASAQLGVKRTTLLDKMRRHGISRPNPDGLLSAI